jgi:hypothetical protein
MWSKGNVGAVSRAERAYTSSPPIFQSLARHLSVGEWFNRRGFGEAHQSFLTETALHLEIVLTYSKQTTAYQSNRDQNCLLLATTIADIAGPEAKEKRNPSALNSAIMVA